MCLITDYIFLLFQNVCSISDLLKSMKLLCLYLWPQQVALTNSLCLEVILRMLKCPHFNARMNGLKEVTVHIYFVGILISLSSVAAFLFYETLQEVIIIFETLLYLILIICKLFIWDSFLSLKKIRSQTVLKFLKSPRKSSCFCYDKVYV